MVKEKIYVIQARYESGWEDECYSDNRTEAKDDLRAYNENVPQRVHRMVVRCE